MAITKKTGFIGRDRGTKAEAQIVLNGVLIPSQIGFVISAGASNVSNVKLSVQDKDGNTIARVHQITVILSDAATGVGLTGTSASGTVQAKAASGTDLAALTAKKALLVQTLADGTYTLEITDSAKTGFYAAAIVPGCQKMQVSRQMVAGDYGA